MADPPSGPTVVIASFDRPEDACEAMITLEGRGFDADDIRLGPRSQGSGQVQSSA
ncbi:MAG: hypothetical protein ACRD0A_19605 [Acidimicrobiales bacterium]